jgi:hypothetical protein
MTIRMAGGGGSGLIQTNSTLTGNGTLGSPLGVAGMPIAFFAWGNQSNAAGEALGAANQIDACGFVLPYPLTFSKILASIVTADAGNNYDIGIYTKAGALVANIGAQPLPSTGAQAFATIQGSQTILPGMYAFGWTGAAITAQLGINQNWNIPWFQSHNIGTGTAGALPASVAAIAVNPAAFTLIFALL